MASWSGWQKQFLVNAELPDTADNRAALTAWANNPNTTCANNPIDLSHKTATSKACKALPGSREAKKYVSHADAIGAFTAQIHSGDFPSLLGAFHSGAPEAVADSQAVYADLRKWGSTFYSNDYLQHVTGSQPSPPTTTTTVKAPRAHGGWADLQRSLNVKWRKSLDHTDRINRASLRSLQRMHKVKG